MQKYKKKLKVKSEKRKVKSFFTQNTTFLKNIRACACVFQKLLVILSSNCVHPNYIPIQMADSEIKHSGVVLSIDGQIARIKILQTSACAACKAREMCVSSESQEKVIDAMMLEPLLVGEKADVIVREQLAWRAILLGYILPFIVMVAVIFAMDTYTALDEAISGSIALCSIAVYYLVLRLFRNKIQKHFSFTARKEN